mmetsp:Transcript_96088/g.276733  ORF Transcript_96088/g.276733 Transcript_96088/m.276733 type:complete len:216 (-) Transcript_96088:225-872(-)
MLFASPWRLRRLRPAPMPIPAARFLCWAPTTDTARSGRSGRRGDAVDADDPMRDHRPHLQLPSHQPYLPPVRPQAARATTEAERTARAHRPRRKARFLFIKPPVTAAQAQPGGRDGGTAVAPLGRTLSHRRGLALGKRRRLTGRRMRRRFGGEPRGAAQRPPPCFEGRYSGLTRTHAPRWRCWSWMTGAGARRKHWRHLPSPAKRTRSLQVKRRR